MADSILQYESEIWATADLLRGCGIKESEASFDHRVLTKQYGRMFLNSLLQCTARQGPAANLSKMASQWLGM